MRAESENCMFRCLLWGTGKYFSRHINIIKYFELRGQIDVIGATSNNTVFKAFFDYPFIPKNNINQLNIDIIVVMAKLSLKTVQQEIAGLGIENVLIIPIDVLTIPSFSFEKYIKLKRETPTIITNNCWGGITYRYLGLEFASPLINMFIEDEEYLKFLGDPQRYMLADLIYQEDEYNSVENFHYPVCACDDILLHFNHYRSFDEAVDCWERRRKRVNWDNLFVMMYTENEDVARQFSNLDYQKKVCFVPFQSDDHSVRTIGFRNAEEWSKRPFWDIVLRMANGSIPYYDAVDLLYDGSFHVVSELY